ncbi:MAG: serine/threonine-protein kinase [Cyanobacteria bacterium P01_D01_bin.71]
MPDIQPAGTLIQSRYKILGVLGRGGSGITYRAEDAFTGRQVALKELSLKGLSDWKKLELFEREAQVLEGLNHPAIPKYVDYFQVDTADNRLFYIAQEIAEGQSLAELVAAGDRFTESEIERIAAAILEVLQYLHDQNPPIIHRDIKPQNIIRRADGRIYLVDFGAVQTVYREATAFGSTVVGTYGYMAPEQFRGQAYPATDLYGLGTTLLHLLTHQNPGDLPQKRLKIEFRSAVSVSNSLANWLDGLLEPLLEDRFVSAEAAYDALTQPTAPRQRGQAQHSGDSAISRHQPSGSKIKLSRSRRCLSLQIPPASFSGETASIATFALFWNGFILVWTSAAAFGGAPIFFVLFALPFWAVGAGLMWMVLNALAGKTTLEVKGDRYILTRQLFKWKQEHTGAARDLYSAELTTAYTQNSRPVKTIALSAGTQIHKFGTPLSNPEKAWVVSEIQAFIKDQANSY